MKKWYFYVFLLSFAVYWGSSLFLWYPWILSEVLGMVLMLTVAPVMWAYCTYQCLRTYPKDRIYKSALVVSLIFLVVSVVFDYIFFGHIRDAMEELYHPTTFYAYAFVVSVPFLAILLFGKRIAHNKKPLVKKDSIQVLLIGLACFVGVVLILLFENQ